MVYGDLARGAGHHGGGEEHGTKSTAVNLGKARRRMLSGGLEEDGMLPWFCDL